MEELFWWGLKLDRQTKRLLELVARAQERSMAGTVRTLIREAASDLGISADGDEPERATSRRREPEAA